MSKKSSTRPPYILLTPGPLSTSPAVKQAMLRDWCTWDDEYKELIQNIRAKLVQLATTAPGFRPCWPRE